MELLKDVKCVKLENKFRGVVMTDCGFPSNCRVSELPLSYLTWRGLQKNGIFTVGELAALSGSEISKLRHINDKGFSEISKLLANLELLDADEDCEEQELMYPKFV